MAKFTAEMKVGIFVSLSLLILASMIVYFGQFNRYFAERSGYEIKALFQFTGGIEKGAPVRFRGVEIGRVNGVEVHYGPPTRVQLSLWLGPEVKLTKGAEAVISSANIMGDKYVEILPGSEEGPVLGPGSIIEGKAPVRLERLVQLGEEITLKLGEVVESVRRIIGGKESEEALRQTIKSTQIITKNLEGVTGNLNGILGDNKENIEAIVKNFRELSETLKIFTKELEEHPTILLRGKRKVRKKTSERKTRFHQ
ncbi:MAG: MCE family protein [Nitrospirae bacterium]|nr:MCE family protein [Nitrospirota bacterium]